MNDSKFTKPRSGGRLRSNYADAPRRATHGGSAWSLPTSERILRQPQDGALTQLAPVAAIDTRKLNGALHEQEDAHLNGTLRSLARRVLGLNVTAGNPHKPIVLATETYFAETHVTHSASAAPRLLQRKGPDTTTAIEPTVTPRAQVA